MVSETRSALRRSSSAIAACIALTMAGSAVAETTVLRNFTLIDGTGKAPVADQALIMTDGKLSWVGPVSKLKAPTGSSVEDLKGKYVMPGLSSIRRPRISTSNCIFTRPMASPPFRRWAPRKTSSSQSAMPSVQRGRTRRAFSPLVRASSSREAMAASLVSISRWRRRKRHAEWWMPRPRRTWTW
jgi:hypothetical protein